MQDKSYTEITCTGTRE